MNIRSTLVEWGTPIVTALLVVNLGLFTSGCAGGGSDGGSTGTDLTHTWGTNLDFYDIEFPGLSDNDFEVLNPGAPMGTPLTTRDTMWSLVFWDNTIQVNAYTADHLGQGPDLSFSATTYSVKSTQENSREVTVNYVNNNVHEVYTLTPSSDTQGSYTYAGFQAGVLSRSADGQYRITTDGKTTDQYKAKYVPGGSTGGSSGGASGGSGSTIDCNSAAYSPWTSVSWENGGMYFSASTLGIVNGDCQKACVASTTNNISELNTRCGYLHYVFDSLSLANATECPVCN